MVAMQFEPEFRDEFENTRYPFSDTATLRADSGMELLLDTFLDASLYPIGAVGNVFLSSIALLARQATFTISAGSTMLATAVFDPLAPPDILRFVDTHGRPAGILVSSSLRLARFSAWPLGSHDFTVNDAAFVASCVIPLPAPGVRGLLSEDNTLLAGDVWLVGDNGVAIREEDNRIRVDVVGDPLFVSKLCGPAGRFKAQPLLRTINHCPPDFHGNYNLTVGSHFNAETVVRIYASEGGLVIEAVGQRFTGTTV